jgi:hypothetical protein
MKYNKKFNNTGKTTGLLFMIFLVIILNSGPAMADTFQLQLYSGWNEISTPFSVTETFSQADPDAVDPLWLHWNPVTGSYESGFLSDPSSLERGKGYWIYANTETIITITGNNYGGEATVAIKPGWNQVGHVYTEELLWGEVEVRNGNATLSVVDAANPPNEWISIILLWFNTHQNHYDSFMHTDNLSGGKGYWLWSNTDSQLVFPARLVLSAIVVKPIEPEVTAGGVIQLTANGYYTNPEDPTALPVIINITDLCQWSVSDTIGWIDQDGVFSAGSRPGTAPVYAVLDDVVGSTNITVIEDSNSIDYISITHTGSANLQTGQSKQLYCSVHYFDGSTHDVTESAFWSSNDPHTVEVTSAGFVTANNAGSAQITAAYNNFVALVSLTVSEAVDDYLEIWEGNENDLRENATPVNTNFLYENLQCNDDDWYKVYLNEGEPVKIEIFFSGEEADIDMYSIDVNWNLLSGSYSVTDNEENIFIPEYTGAYFIRVYPYSGYAGYSMIINENFDDLAAINVYPESLTMEEGEYVNFSVYTEFSGAIQQNFGTTPI